MAPDARTIDYMLRASYDLDLIVESRPIAWPAKPLKLRGRKASYYGEPLQLLPAQRPGLP